MLKNSLESISYEDRQKIKNMIDEYLVRQGFEQGEINKIVKVTENNDFEGFLNLIIKS